MLIEHWCDLCKVLPLPCALVLLVTKSTAELSLQRWTYQLLKLLLLLLLIKIIESLKNNKPKSLFLNQLRSSKWSKMSLLVVLGLGERWTNFLCSDCLFCKRHQFSEKKPFWWQSLFGPCFFFSGFWTPEGQDVIHNFEPLSLGAVWDKLISEA